MRLMGTATDGGRKAIIQDSLKNLESPERNLSKKMGQGTPNVYETEKVTDLTTRINSFFFFRRLVGIFRNHHQ
jgi:fructose-specific component phosphotransferase system IIB-like protein